jgi:hypothetical protein
MAAMIAPTATMATATRHPAVRLPYQPGQRGAGLVGRRESPRRVKTEHHIGFY